jgi:hypothetical protein
VRGEGLEKGAIRFERGFDICLKFDFGSEREIAVALGLKERVWLQTS